MLLILFILTAHNILYIYIYQLVPLKIDLWIDLEHNLKKHNRIIKLFTTLPNQIQLNLFDEISDKDMSKINSESIKRSNSNLKVKFFNYTWISEGGL